MALLTQFASFFVSPFGEVSVCDELNRFIKSHRIVNIEKRLVDNDKHTGWLFLIEYGNDAKISSNNVSHSGSPRVDYRELLSEQEYALYDQLRNLRKKISERNGVPVYAVFTNEQLAAMVKNPPSSVKDMMSISGVGEAKAKQYGEYFLPTFSTIASTSFETPKSSV